MTTQPLFPCQQKAIARLVKGEPVYLAFDMGLGKRNCETVISGKARRP
jgi:hypothetical protein